MHYKLLGKIVVPAKDVLDWATWCQSNSRIVRQDHIGPLFVSTVFLGLDHDFTGKGPPLVFETMIFDGNDDAYQTRCATWHEAEFMHEAALVEARQRLATATRLLEESK